jgi:hypothetical protein
MTNQEKLKNLLSDADITQAQAAEYIAISTRRPCSARSVRAWLAEPDLPSARACPDYAIQNLEAHLKFLKKIP